MCMHATDTNTQQPTKTIQLKCTEWPAIQLSNPLQLIVAIDWKEGLGLERIERNWQQKCYKMFVLGRSTAVGKESSGLLITRRVELKPTLASQCGSRANSCSWHQHAIETFFQTFAIQTSAFFRFQFNISCFCFKNMIPRKLCHYFQYFVMGRNRNKIKIHLVLAFLNLGIEQGHVQVCMRLWIPKLWMPKPSRLQCRNQIKCALSRSCMSCALNIMW